MNIRALFNIPVILPHPHPSARMNDGEWLRGCLSNHERYTEQSAATRYSTVPPAPPPRQPKSLFPE